MDLGCVVTRMFVRLDFFLQISDAFPRSSRLSKTDRGGDVERKEKKMCNGLYVQV
jgi:hypothetical protein